jgi:dual specificity MAP kinase phosphatase
LADRLVLIQPNLRFFHELFGWEVELARREEDDRQRLMAQMREQGLVGPDGVVESPGARKKREILYSWPSFCRDLVSRLTTPRECVDKVVLPEQAFPV